MGEQWGTPHSTRIGDTRLGSLFRPFSVVAVGAVRKDGGGEDGTTGKFSSPLQFHPENPVPINSSGWNSIWRQLEILDIGNG